MNIYNIEEISLYAEKSNISISNFQPGGFRQNGRGTLEAILAKVSYFENDLDYVLSVFESLQKSHCFFDGNKRTSILILEFLCEINNCLLVETEKLSDILILYIENKIDKEEFIDLVKGFIYI